VTAHALVEVAVFFVVLLLLAKPLGSHMARIYQSEHTFLDRWLGPLERAIYRFSAIDATREMTWRGYALAMLALQLVGFLAAYALQRFQGSLPLNPQGLPAVTPDCSLDTAVSFVTNTNWQSYSGETTMSYLTQMGSLCVQNFVSAASGLAVLAALIRGFSRSTSKAIGNFWVDVTRSTLYVLLPLALVVAVALASQGVVQTFQPSAHAAWFDASVASDKTHEQVLAVGPAASQIAIKQLGTNGGGFFNVNSAHPFENPTPLSNFIETLSILLIPAASCFALGRMVEDSRQGRALIAAMLVMLVPLTVGTILAEQHGNPRLASLGLDDHASATQPGGNMEGKEARFGVVESSLWAAATTAASNGSVNSMHDSFTPLGGLIPMVLMQLGEVVFGGVGSGLYGLLVFAIIAVFVAGLMVGRTPEYLGKKLEVFEMKMASLAILAPCFAVLIGTAVAVETSAGRAGIFNPGAHGFSEVLYAFSSASNNNGSAFAGLSANTPFYNVALALAMLLGRYLVKVPVLAIAGSLAAKKNVPASSGTLPTHDPLFVFLLVGVVLIVGALTFIPALALGPIVEHLAL
jgi:K+-transporting ATPase ATPase A chain